MRVDADSLVVELERKIAENEDLIRERTERMILENHKVIEMDEKLEGIDPSNHSDEEVAKHLDQEVNNLLNSLYDTESLKKFVSGSLSQKLEACADKMGSAFNGTIDSLEKLGEFLEAAKETGLSVLPGNLSGFLLSLTGLAMGAAMFIMGGFLMMVGNAAMPLGALAFLVSIMLISFSGIGLEEHFNEIYENLLKVGKI